MSGYEDHIYVNPVQMEHLQNGPEQRPSKPKNNEIPEETLKTIRSVQQSLRLIWLFLLTLLLIMVAEFLTLYFSISAKEGTKGFIANQQLLMTDQQISNGNVSDEKFILLEETLQHNMSNVATALKRMESGFWQLQDNLTRSSSSPSGPEVQCTSQSYLFTQLLSSSASRIFYNNLTSYYKFAYDARNNYSISDGGHDMYDTGNELRVWKSSGIKVRVYYNWTYSDPDGEYLVVSKALHPFVVSMLVLNCDGASRQYYIEEKSNLGADGSGNYTWDNGSLMVGSYNIQYVLYQVYGAGDPSIIQIYFTASSPKLGSSGSSSLSYVDNQRNTGRTDNEVIMTGNAHNVYFNYILTSKYPPTYVQASTVEGILKEIFQD